MALDNQIFLVENLVTTAALSASTTNAQYPLANLKDDRRTKTFRSTANYTTIDLDFQTLRDVNVIAFVDDGVSGFGFSSATLQLNAVPDSWSSPIANVPLSIDTLYGFAYAYIDVPVTCRYARVVLSGTAGYVEVAKMFIGQSAQLGELSFSYPLAYSENNNATITKNRLGQKFIDEVNVQREISGSINTLTKEEFQPLLDLIHYCSITRPIWLIFPEGNITEDNDQINGYYYLRNEPKPSFVTGNFWNVSLAFEEAT